MTDLRNGYYATLDPADPATMTYWRVRNSAATPWPAKAWYGPARPLRRDAPADADARIAWLRLWQTGYREWLHTVLDTLDQDPAAARRRFADLSTRCCLCGRALHDDRSKVLGVGPDCREGVSEEMLAQLVTPAIAAAHAAQLAAAEGA
ncbi:hypothetical protein EES45_23080 [Streptomyces sp. ADI97-07]|uniref:DUF6011 domain-containing protein n=1 Tax=Streptomyces sp. ADI97-07 TaxID=1522762 RepID=UPI000F55928E|nr:DUF6011 domain-containing protein [Streptomyces sp. ADI97-07]RPK76378.1 hypothetical protein EES45_23080 [Streptomyces sp. ADI97-07]